MAARSNFSSLPASNIRKRHQLELQAQIKEINTVTPMVHQDLIQRSPLLNRPSYARFKGDEL